MWYTADLCIGSIAPKDISTSIFWVAQESQKVKEMHSVGRTTKTLIYTASYLIRWESSSGTLSESRILPFQTSIYLHAV